MNAQLAQITARYAPMRVTETPEMIDVTEAVKENGIILEKSTESRSRRQGIGYRSHLTPAPVADDPRTWKYSGR
jgi:hypothetical protein